MSDINPSIEIETISGIVANFDWELIKQTITKEDITLVIRKEISSAGKISSSPAD